MTVRRAETGQLVRNCCGSVVSCYCEKLVAEAEDISGTKRKGDVHR
jgi:hypothetical protein